MQIKESGREDRRPLKVRNTRFAAGVARWLSLRAVTPNQISILSVIFAALAALFFVSSAHMSSEFRPYFLLGAAGAIQLRLLCNLFDGMVAVEGGKKTASGELFNDVPDRIADPLILVAAGYSLGTLYHGMEWGWAAGVLAVMTAYVRILGASLGLKSDFSGPMAKQHRMAVLTIACVISVIEPWIGWRGEIIALALVLIVLGGALTVILRVRSAYMRLEQT